MLLVLAALCAVCEAVFTAMEVALGALSRARLRALAEEEQDEQARGEENGTPAASNGASHAADAGGEPKKPFVRRSQRALSRPERLLALLEHSNRLSLSFITVTSLSLWSGGALLTWQALRDSWSPWSLALSLGGLLFFAEAIPLVIAGRNPEGIALRGVGLIEKSVQGLAPLAWVLGGLGSLVARIFGARSHTRPEVTEGELRHALDQAEHEGVIEPEERAMLESAIDFRAKSVSQVMTPRLDIVAVPALMPLRAVLDVAMKGGHSRLPVYQGSTDHIIGIIATKDLLRHLRPRAASDASTPSETAPMESMTAGEVARPPFFLPVSKRVDAAMDDLRHQRMLMAIVVEPDGGTAGLVTLEDLLEEIVGEIEDEYDEAEAPLRLLEFESEPASSASQDGASGGSPASAASSARGRGIVADASCTVRQAEKFWRRHFRESLVLLGRAPTTPSGAAANGAVPEAAADESLSLAALAQQLFDGVPQQGQSVLAGAIVPTNTARGALGTVAVAERIVMEISHANGPRLEEVCLVRAIEAEPMRQEPAPKAIS